MTQNPAPRKLAAVESLADVMLGFAKVDNRRVTPEEAHQWAGKILAELKEQGEQWLPQLVERFGLRYTVAPDVDGSILDVSFWGGSMWHTVETLWYKE